MPKKERGFLHLDLESYRREWEKIYEGEERKCQTTRV